MGWDVRTRPIAVGRFAERERKRKQIDLKERRRKKRVRERVGRRQEDNNNNMLPQREGEERARERERERVSVRFPPAVRSGGHARHPRPQSKSTSTSSSTCPTALTCPQLVQPGQPVSAVPVAAQNPLQILLSADVHGWKRCAPRSCCCVRLLAAVTATLSSNGLAAKRAAWPRTGTPGELLHERSYSLIHSTKEHSLSGRVGALKWQPRMRRRRRLE